MIERHLEIEDLADALAAPPDDPRLVHLRACSRCQVLHQSYAAFLAEPELSAAEHRALNARLPGVLDACMPNVAAGSSSALEPGAGSRATRLNKPRPGSARFRIKPVWALAASLLIISGILVVGGLRRESHEIVLREHAGTPGDLRPGVVQIESLDLSADGAVEIQWHPVPGANAYDVQFYSANLKEVAHFGPLAQPRLLLPHGEPALAAAPDTVFVRVTALRDSDPWGTSRLATLRLR